MDELSTRLLAYASAQRHGSPVTLDQLAAAVGQPDLACLLAALRRLVESRRVVVWRWREGEVGEWTRCPLTVDEIKEDRFTEGIQVWLVPPWRGDLRRVAARGG